MIELTQKTIKSKNNYIKPNSLNFVLNTLSILIIFSVSLCVFYQFLTDDYSNDIHQFMYQGSRLLEGELLFTKEFDDVAFVDIPNSLLQEYEHMPWKHFLADIDNQIDIFDFESVFYC